jgi:hypothetical protein
MNPMHGGYLFSFCSHTRPSKINQGLGNPQCWTKRPWQP